MTGMRVGSSSSGSSWKCSKMCRCRARTGQKGSLRDGQEKKRFPGSRGSQSHEGDGGVEVE